jgi:hypothetical protein
VYRAPIVALRRGYAQVREDLRADPYLLSLLLGATLLASFWLWHRLPNFATRDERWRVLDVIQPVGFFLEDGDPLSIREGITYWRSYGGTFYVYGLVLLPVLLFFLAAGESATLVDMANYSVDSLRADWQRVPGWAWTAAVLPARLANVALAVGCVYLVYRIGTAVRDRATGRLAALLTSLTWGLLVLAHEAGEDVPSLFFFLLALYLALEYVDSGSRRTFYWGCLSGGVAAGLKFSAGVSALLLGAALLTRARRAEGTWRAAFGRPRFLLTGVVIGTLAILCSYPQVLVGAPTEFGGRITRGVQAKGETHSWLVQPSWWWLARGWLNGLGLPLAFASVGGLFSGLGWLRESSRVGDFARLALLATGTTLLVYAQWAYVRTHHLLVLFPLAALLVAVGARRLGDRRPTIARALVALLVLSTGAYAVAGDLGYAAQGRDQSAAFLAADADPGDTVEVYVRDPQEMGVSHDLALDRPAVPGGISAFRERCPEYVLLESHRALIYLAPPSHSNRARQYDSSVATEHVRALLAEDTYPYEVAGEFGPRPRYLDEKPRRPAWRRLLHAGVQPRVMQYGDPQDLGPYQYTVVMKRTGSCDEGADTSASLAG